MKAGLQLYSVRDVCKADPWGTLQKVYDIGYRAIELGDLYGQTAVDWRAHADALGMAIPSTHCPLDDMCNDWDAKLEEFLTLGVNYVALPWLHELRTPDLDALAARVNDIRTVSAKLKAHGIQLMHHNHDFEFRTENGQYLLDFLFDQVGLEFICPQLDVCWVQVGGADPGHYIRKYAGHVPVVHLKDYTIDAKAVRGPLYQLTGQNTQELADKSSFEPLPLGLGLVDFDAVLAAAEDSGTAWVIVEQDESNGRSTLEAVTISQQLLQSKGL